MPNIWRRERRGVFDPAQIAGLLPSKERWISGFPAVNVGPPLMRQRIQ
jgi:hypothetical protein